MKGTRIVAKEKDGRVWVFGSAEEMIEIADDKVTHSGEEVDAEWIEKKLSSGVIEWLKLYGVTFETVERAWKVEPWN